MQIFPAGAPLFPVPIVFMVKTFAVHETSEQACLFSPNTLDQLKYKLEQIVGSYLQQEALKHFSSPCPQKQLEKKYCLHSTHRQPLLMAFM